MSIIEFPKVRELFPNRKVRVVRTEQLWFVRANSPACPQNVSAPIVHASANFQARETSYPRIGMSVKSPVTLDMPHAPNRRGH